MRFPVAPFFARFDNMRCREIGLGHASSEHGFLGSLHAKRASDFPIGSSRICTRKAQDWGGIRKRRSCDNVGEDGWLIPLKRSACVSKLIVPGPGL